MRMKLDDRARAILSRVWPKYTATIPRHGDPVDVYRAERDAYVREINTSDAVVAAIDRIDIPGPGGPIPVRIYRPVTDAEGPLPVTLYFHGGGWTVGGGDALDGTYRALCAEVGCLLFVPDYRLAPEHKFPAAHDDAVAAARWLAAHAAEIGGDPARLAVAGESSGGNLAAVVAQAFRSDPSVRFAVQVLVYPALDLRAATPSYGETEDVFTRDKMLWYIDAYVRDAADKTDPRGSPVLAADFSGLPKTLLVGGGADPLVDEGEDYLAKIRAAGVEAEYLKLEGWPHGFAFWPETEAHARMNEAVVGTLRRALGLAAS